MMSEDSKLIVLVDEALREIVELLWRLVTPPVHQVAKLIILTSYNTQRVVWVWVSKSSSRSSISSSRSSSSSSSSYGGGGIAVRTALRPTRYFAHHFRESFPAITCTGTDDKW